MSAWSGGWFGAWDGDWLGASEAAGGATGVTFTADASLLAGVASGGRRAIQPSGVRGPEPHRRIVRIDARVPGVLLECWASLLPGRASAVGLISGRAFGAATAKGMTSVRTMTLRTMVATGEQSELSAEEWLILDEAA